MNRQLTDRERCELRELHHIILGDMAVDAGEAAAFALGLAAEAIETVLVSGVIVVDADDEDEASAD